MLTDPNPPGIHQPLSNAAKFAAEGGSSSASFRGGKTVCRVKDTGIGVSEAQRAIVQAIHSGGFFHDTKIRRYGPGADDLPALVDAMDGSIALENEVGVGTTFTVTLPPDSLTNWGLLVNGTFSRRSCAGCKRHTRSRASPVNCCGLGVCGALGRNYTADFAMLATSNRSRTAHLVGYDCRMRAVPRWNRSGVARPEHAAAGGDSPVWLRRADTVGQPHPGKTRRKDSYTGGCNGSSAHGHSPEHAPHGSQPRDCGTGVAGGRRHRNRQVALGMLKLRGVTPDLALNGQEAVDAATRQHYDVIFMDGQMPVVDGFAATSLIRAAERELAAPRCPWSHTASALGLTASASGKLAWTTS